MLRIDDTLDEHLAFYHSNGIDTTSPGFYDEPNFMAIEKIDADFLNTYASFIKHQKYEEGYLERAKKIIDTTSAFLFDELKKEGSKGRCVEVSIIFSRILEKLGIWNFIAKGSLTVTLPPKLAIPKQYFWSIDTNPHFDAGHAWLFVPPYQIVDLTLKYQPYTFKIEDYIPDYILAEKGSKASLDMEDIVAATILAPYKLVRMTSTTFIKNNLPHLLPFTKIFQPQKLKINGVEFKYTQTAIGAPDMPLETLPKKLNGKLAIDLYHEIKKLI